MLTKIISRLAKGLAFHPCMIVIPMMLVLLTAGELRAQGSKQLVRLAKLVIDSTQVENYQAALKLEIETSVRVEPGVITLYAMFEKENPTRVTILEIYADSSAYKAHLLTPHFLKYKHETKEMVKSLELVENVPIVPGMKIK